eukprot:197711-Alexandrium_andersonii.AAC.1
MCVRSANQAAAQAAGRDRALKRASLAQQLISNQKRPFELLRPPPAKRLVFLESGGKLEVTPSRVDAIA